MLENVLGIFPKELRLGLSQCQKELVHLEEIRIRIGKPIIFLMRDRELYYNRREQRLSAGGEDAYIAGREDVETILAFLSKYSLYAFEEELRSGFITLEGGHRVGVAGQVVMENGSISQINHITFLNIRVAHQRVGCAKEIYPYLHQGSYVYNTLFVSSVGVGKTTYLRDSIRMLSGEDTKAPGYRVGVVDERSEIAACHLGIPQNNLGIRTDVMDRCLKSDGMLMLLRSMAPQIIAVDELGSEADFKAVEQVVNSGCSIIGTIHAADIRELRNKVRLHRWIEQRIFERFVVLKRDKEGRRFYEIYDGMLGRI